MEGTRTLQDAEIAPQLRVVLREAAPEAAEREGRSHKDGIAYFMGGLQRSFHRRSRVR